MRRRIDMGKIAKLILIILFLSFLSSPYVQASSGNGRRQIPTYTVSTTPSEVNMNQTVQIAVSVTGGQSNAKYVFNITVTEPDQASYSVAEYALTTDGNGSGIGEVPYPFGFHGGNSASATNQVGIYAIRVDQILPKYRYGVAASSFTVTSSLTLNILAPTVGIHVDRGFNLSLIVLVDDVNGSPDSNVRVNASLPGQEGTIEIPQTQQAGIFASSYRIRWNDLSGLWNLSYLAADDAGNRGEASIGVNITTAQLSIQGLSASDAAGQPRRTFYNNDTISFRVEADYLDGSRVTSGASSVVILNPNGRVMVTLALVYNPQINAYQTLTGFQLAQTSMIGTWTAVVSADSLGDGFGNVGPSAPVSLQFSVIETPTAYGNSQNPIQRSGTPFDILPIVLLLGSFAAPIAMLPRKKRVDTKDDLEQLIQQAGSAEFTLIEGDKQTGKSTTIDLITARTIERGGNAMLLTFENSPADVRSRMMQLGIDSSEYEEKGDLQIIDCSNVSESLSLGFVRSKLLNAFDGRKEPSAVFIDSLDLLYEELEEKEVQDLVEGLRGEVKARKGTLYATATTSNLPSSSLTSLENTAPMVLQTMKCSLVPAPAVMLRINKAPEKTEQVPGTSMVIGRPDIARRDNPGTFGHL